MSYYVMIGFSVGMGLFLAIIVCSGIVFGLNVLASTWESTANWVSGAVQAWRRHRALKIRPGETVDQYQSRLAAL